MSSSVETRGQSPPSGPNNGTGPFSSCSKPPTYQVATSESPFCTAASELVQAFGVRGVSGVSGVSSSTSAAAADADAAAMSPPKGGPPRSTVSFGAPYASPGASHDLGGPSRLMPHLTVDLIKPHMSALQQSANLSPNVSASPLECSLAGSGGPCPSCPPHGAKAVCGKRAKMEDTYVVQVNFFDVPNACNTIEELQCDKLPHRLASLSPGSLSPNLKPFAELPAGTPPPSPQGAPISPGSAQPSPASFLEVGRASFHSDACTGDSLDTLHFFGVYDGHGGSEASQHCAGRLHHHLAEALASVCSQAASEAYMSPRADLASPWEAPEAKGVAVITCPETDSLAVPMDIPGGEMQGCHARGAEAMTMDMGVTEQSGSPVSEHANRTHRAPGSPHVASSSLSDCQLYTRSSSRASSASSSGSSSSSTTKHFVTLLEDALRIAFLKTDEEYASHVTASTVGSTAVVAVLGNNTLWVANCGDSRAVLCRGGRAMQVTDDHKPEREDEAERVEKAGGQILFWNGHRVMGVLAMSRAIGDHGLRPYVIAEPEISILQRHPDDEFLLLASDGLWDVMTNQEATHLAKRCMLKAKEKGASSKASVRVAVSVLTSAALDRGSKDNVTVVIVDLKGKGNGPCRSNATSGGGATAASVHDGLVVDLDPLVGAGPGSTIKYTCAHTRK